MLAPDLVTGFYFAQKAERRKMYSQEILRKVESLRKVLEDANWKMSDKDFWELGEAHHKLLPENFILPRHISGFYQGKQIFRSTQNLICGAHGHYIELIEDDFSCKLEVTKGQEWRETDKYSYVKYSWLNPIGIPELKVYLQKHTVKYADYKPRRYYVDFWAIELK